MEGADIAAAGGLGAVFIVLGVLTPRAAVATPIRGASCDGGPRTCAWVRGARGPRPARGTPGGPGRGFRSACVSRSTPRDTSAGAAHVGRTPGGRLRSFHRRRRRAQERPCRHGPWSRYNDRYNEINVSGESAYRSMVDRAVPRSRPVPPTLDPGPAGSLRDAPGRRGPGGSSPPAPARSFRAFACARTARGRRVTADGTACSMASLGA